MSVVCGLHKGHGSWRPSGSTNRPKSWSGCVVAEVRKPLGTPKDAGRRVNRRARPDYAHGNPSGINGSVASGAGGRT